MSNDRRRKNKIKQLMRDLDNPFKRFNIHTHIRKETIVDKK